MSMPSAMTQEELFQEIIATRTRGDESSVEFRAICIAAGLFEDDPGIKKARESYMDRRIRALARMGGWVDKDGNPTELVNIVRANKSTGKKVHHWIQLRLLTFEDQVYLVKDRLRKHSYFYDEAKRYYDDGCTKFGRKFQKQFQF